jgi:hypothetical protein
MIKIRLAALLLVTATFVFAQHVLILTNGVQIHGRYAGGNADSITFIESMAASTRSILRRCKRLLSVARFRRRSRLSRVTLRAHRLPNPHLPNVVTRIRTSSPLPAGTIPESSRPARKLSSGPIDPIEVRHPDPRQHFLVSVEQDVLDASGNVVIQRGSPAHLIVHEVVDVRSPLTSGQSALTAGASSSIVRTSPTHVSAMGSAPTHRCLFVGGTALLGTLFGVIAGAGAE